MWEAWYPYALDKGEKLKETARAVVDKPTQRSKCCFVVI